MYFCGRLLLLTIATHLSVVFTHHRSSRKLPGTIPPGPLKRLCDDHGIKCLTHSQIPFGFDCYQPFTTGPCPEGKLIALEKSYNMTTLMFVGICISLPCESGMVLHEERCISEEEASNSLCGGKPVHLDPETNIRCGADPGMHNIVLRYVDCMFAPI